MKTSRRGRSLVVATAVCQILVFGTLLSAQPEQIRKGEEKKDMRGVKDFDFFTGEWRVHHRRLNERLANSHEWIEFDGTCAVRKILGGLGNMDDNVLDMPGGAYNAVTVRTYDPVKEQWSIWWIDSRHPGSLDPPVVGRFENGVGTFYADDHFKGKPIRVRFLWTQRSSTPHWEQAFSTDGGKTWETNWTMDFERTATNGQSCCPVVELRQYTLHPGQRDVLIELFDHEFIESQEALGMEVVGQFRDLSDPNRFVWLRGFRNMPSRARALEDFYGGPVWRAHRDAANATMIDSNNVLLLRPAHSGSEFQIKNDRPKVGAKTNGKDLIIATIYYFDAPVTDDFIRFFESTMKPTLTETNAPVLAYFVTEQSKNNFPRLPVREEENVFVWFTSFRDEASYEDHLARLNKSPRWLEEVTQALTRSLKRSPEVLRLSPTERSRLRGHA
jgi:hypothetical protein